MTTPAIPHGPAVHILSRPDVIVVGAGIIGLSCARELAAQGLRVDVVEAEDVGRGASSAAAGLLSAIGEAEPGTPFSRVLLQAHSEWPSWAAQLEATAGMEIGLETSPTLCIELEDEESGFIERTRQAAVAAGFRFEMLSGEELRQSVAGINPVIQRGVLIPDEHRVDPKRVLAALARDLERSGVPIHRRRRVATISSTPRGNELFGDGWQITVPRLILATGAWTSFLSGPALPEIVPVRGQMIRFADFPHPWQGGLRTSSGYVLTRGGDLLAGASMERVGFDESTTSEVRRSLITLAEAVFPSLRWKRVTEQWAGLRPVTASGTPAIALLNGGTLLTALGHFRNGILLAPWTARVITELALHGESADLPDSFRWRPENGAGGTAEKRSPRRS